MAMVVANNNKTSTTIRQLATRSKKNIKKIMGWPTALRFEHNNQEDDHEKNIHRKAMVKR